MFAPLAKRFTIFTCFAVTLGEHHAKASLKKNSCTSKIELIIPYAGWRAFCGFLGFGTMAKKRLYRYGSVVYLIGIYIIDPLMWYGLGCWFNGRKQITRSTVRTRCIAVCGRCCYCNSSSTLWSNMCRLCNNLRSSRISQ